MISRPLWHCVRHVITLRSVAAKVVADEPEFVVTPGVSGPAARTETVVVVEVPASSAVPPAGMRKARSEVACAGRCKRSSDATPSATILALVLPLGAA